jgi:hypothetical protein
VAIAALVVSIVSAAAGAAGLIYGRRSANAADRSASAADRSAEAFDRTVARENETWRKALHAECLLNLNLSKERDREQAWSFDTGCCVTP